MEAPPRSRSTSGGAYATAAQCLARETELQAKAETGGGEYLWIWEVATSTVVMGASTDCTLEIHHEACERAGVPILRRESGGRTVLLSKGCLNYALILRDDGTGIHTSYQLILDAVIEASGVLGARRQ